MIPAQMVPDMVYAMLLLALRVGSTLLIGWWLYKHWKRGRESAYLWLLVGIGLFPLLHMPATMATEMVLSYTSTNWGWPRSDWNLSHRVRSILFFSAKYLCIFVALSKFAGGAVRFTDVVAPWQAEL